MLAINQIAFSPSTINFPNLYLKLHLLHPYGLVKSFLPLPYLCIYSILLPYMPLIHMDIRQKCLCSIQDKYRNLTRLVQHVLKQKK
jgi:hypothetical protein